MIQKYVKFFRDCQHNGTAMPESLAMDEFFPSPGKENKSAVMVRGIFICSKTGDKCTFGNCPKMVYKASTEQMSFDKLFNMFGMTDKPIQ